jgi:hypothetical protein
MWDGIAQFYPWRLHYSRSIASGALPLTNPHQFCGTPFVANAQTAVFYPLNLIFVLISPVRAFGVSAALHFFLAGVFTFLLARALGMGRFGATVAAIVFEFSAFMVVWTELPTLINVATWLPLALLLILKSMDRNSAANAIFAGLALGLSILAGHFQIASYVVSAAALWWVWLIAGKTRSDRSQALRRGVPLAVLCFVVALLIAAPQILPTMELAKMSHRVRSVTAEGYATYVGNAAPPGKLITLFVPNFYGNPSSAQGYLVSNAKDFASNYMEYAFYIGLLPFLLALFGAIFTIRWRNVGFFVMLGLLSLLFVFGSPINYLTYHFMPGTSALGGPNRVIVLFCFSAAILAGFGAHWFLQKAQDEYKATRRKLGWRALAVGGATLGIVFIAAQNIASASLTATGIDPSKVMVAVFNEYVSFGSLLVAGLVVLVLYTAGSLSKPLFGALAMAVIVADLFSFGIHFNPTCRPEEVYPPTKLTNWLKENAGSSRLMVINRNWSLYKEPDVLLPPNAATVYGLYDMQGYDSLFPKRYKEFVDTQLQMDSSPPENGNMLLIRSFTSNWPKGTAGYVLSADPIDTPGVKQVFEANGVKVYRLSSNGNGEKPYRFDYEPDSVVKGCILGLVGIAFVGLGIGLSLKGRRK